MKKKPPMTGPNPGAELQTTLQEEFRKLLAYGKQHSLFLLLAVILAAVCTLCTLFSPSLISQMVKLISDGLQRTMDLSQILRLAAILGALYAFSTVCSITQHFLMTKVTYHFSRSLRRDIFRKIHRLPMAFFHKTPIGETLSRVTNDVDVISQSMNQSVGMLAQALTLLTGSVILMSVTNVVMMLTAVISSFVGFSAMRVIMERSQRHFSRQQSCLGQINGYIEEIYTGHLTVKAFGSEASVSSVFNQLNEQLRSHGLMAQCYAGIMQPLMNMVGNLSYVAVCVVGVLLTLHGRIGFEVIVAFMMYVHYFTQPLSQLAQVAQSFQAAAAACQRVFSFLDEPEMEEESHKPAVQQDVTGTISFDHVWFRYEGSDDYVIQDFTFTAEPGQKIAIVGATGAGKTTLANLLLRFYEPQQGSICIDGIPIDQIQREALRSNIAMVLQEGWVFEASVRENLTLGAALPEERIRDVCRQVKIDSFIQSLPKGYDTVLNDMVRLSHGQKQQLTIARAMLADKPILILDEATSSVDIKTEYDIQNAMDCLMENRTVLVIAHRLSTIRNADQILVLENGRILESGTHAQLLRQNGFYSELHRSIR